MDLEGDLPHLSAYLIVPRDRLGYRHGDFPARRATPVMTDNVSRSTRRSWLDLIRSRRGELSPLGVVRPRRERVALCAIARNEGFYLDEWVRYHLGLGFDDVFIYDNESTDGGFDVLRKQSRVHVRSWPDPPDTGPQLPAYTHFFQNSSLHYDWAIFLDIDEFLNIKITSDVHSFLELFTDVDGVAINWRFFGSAGHEAYQPGSVIDRFQKAATVDFPPHAHVKTFFRPSKITNVEVHSPMFVRNSRLVDCKKNLLPLDRSDVFVQDINFDIAQINHYFTKSCDEFRVKRLRGRADFAGESPHKYRTESEFAAYDRNEEEDSSILRLRR